MPVALTLATLLVACTQSPQNAEGIVLVGTELTSLNLNKLCL